MRASSRVIWGIVLFLSVYVLALRIVPSLCAFLGLAEALPWIRETGLVSQGTFLIVSLALIAAFGRGDLGRYGLKTAQVRPVARAVAISALTMLVLMSPMILMALGGSQPSDETSEEPGFGPRGLPETVLFVWLIASACEEVFYRGLLQGFLSPLAAYGVRLRGVYLSVPVVLCAVLFGLGHLCLLGRVPGPMLAAILVSTTTAGFVAGYYRERTGSLLPAVASHMTFNVVGTMVPLLLNLLIE